MGKMYLVIYTFAHDTTVIPLVAALQNKLPEYPPYASAFLFELYQSAETKDYFVRAIYNNKVLILPDCWKAVCPYSVFKNMILSHYIIKDVAYECDPYRSRPK